MDRRSFAIALLFSVSSALAGEPIFKPTGRYAENPVEAPKTSPKLLKPLVWGNPWVETATHYTSDKHLVEVHGFAPQQLVGLTQDQKNRLHGGCHEQSMRLAPQSNCPGGVCPTPTRRRRRE